MIVEVMNKLSTVQICSFPNFTLTNPITIPFLHITVK